MDDRKTVNYNAGQPLWFWSADRNDTTHLRMKLEMDHDIDGGDLLEAWKKTMKVYPLLNWIPDKVRGDLLFYEPESEPVVVNYDGPLMPCTELAGGRPIAISYYGNAIVLTFYHSIADAAGIVGVLRTLVYHYCTLHFHREYDAGGIMLTENRAVETYYRSPFRLDLGAYTPQPLAFYPLGDTIFTDPEMAPPKPGDVVTSSATISAEEFLRYCKAHGANPSVMLCILMGKAIYHSHPEERRRLALDVTVNYRKALGLPDCLGVFSTVATVCATYDQIMEGGTESAAAALREALNRQRTEDYAKTMMDMARTYLILKDALSAVISYEGRIDFGSCNRHVTGMFLVNNVTNTIHMIEFKEDFILHFQFGKATEFYRNAFINELKEAGISIKAQSGAFIIPKEIREMEE